MHDGSHLEDAADRRFLILISVKNTSYHLDSNLFKQRAKASFSFTEWWILLTSQQPFCCVGVTVFQMFCILSFGNETSQTTQQMLHAELCQLHRGGLESFSQHRGLPVFSSSASSSIT